MLHRLVVVDAFLFQDIQNILLKKPQTGSNQHDSFMLVHALLCVGLEQSGDGVVGCFKFWHVLLPFGDAV